MKPRGSTLVIKSSAASTKSLRKGKLINGLLSHEGFQTQMKKRSLIPEPSAKEIQERKRRKETEGIGPISRPIWNFDP